MTHLRLARIALLLVLVFSIASTVSAATRSWNTLSGNWDTSSNWLNANIPAAGDDAFIVESDGISRIVTYDYSGSNITLSSLSLDLTGGISSATNTLFMPLPISLTATTAVVGNNGSGTINNVASSSSFTNLTLGNYFNSTGVYNLGATASLNTFVVNVGSGGAGTFHQNGGNHFSNSIALGQLAGSSGIYNFTAGQLSTGTETVGANGAGTFTHSGGVNSVTSLVIGDTASATGVYNLGVTGGLVAGQLTVGNAGNGTFNQTGGYNTVLNSAGLQVGASGYGAYNLSGNGQLAVSYGESIGNLNGSTGVFTQTGGANSMNADLLIAPNLGSTGSYSLSGGTLYAPNVRIGGHGSTGGLGTLSVGGTGSLNTPGIVEIFPSAGSGITLSGGSITAGSLQFDTVSSQFNWTSGSLTITGPNPLTLGAAGPLHDTILTASKSLTVYSGAVNDAVLIVDGGSFAGALTNTGTFIVNSGNALLDSSINYGEINLGGNQAIISGVPATGHIFNSNTGLLHGDGTFDLPVDNSGEIRAENGKRLSFTAGVGNLGQINLQGGTIESSLPMTNYAQISGRGTLKFGGAGLTNQGDIALSGGITDVYGPVNNNTFSASHGITITSQANVTFWNDVANTSGIFKVNPGSSATFFGAFSGNGITGAGNVDFESNINPGFSPASVTLGGNVNLGAAAHLNIELGGTNPGQFDQVNVAGQLALDGTLNISLINGFYPQVGQSFNILNWGSLSGQFSNIQTPLGDHIVWNSSQLYTLGNLSIVATYYAGDFNRDGHVDAADILAGQTALADISGFEAQYGLSPANASLIDDLNGDGVFNAADMQFLLNDIKNGGGSANPVPEPSTLVLFTAGSLLGLVALRRNRR